MSRSTDKLVCMPPRRCQTILGGAPGAPFLPGGTVRVERGARTPTQKEPAMPNGRMPSSPSMAVPAEQPSKTRVFLQVSALGWYPVTFGKRHAVPEARLVCR